MIAERAKAARLGRGWSRQELARRAGISPETIKGLEQTGRITLGRLLAIAGALGALTEFTELFPAPVARSLDDLEAAAPVRQRGRTFTPDADHRAR
ncbi:MAG: helix-turn-helix transcriptional regulator [Gemmatimonadales bacterium]|nr:helix-turn-helix transcriptional regulator [Gemmatimonadales bacterium]